MKKIRKWVIVLGIIPAIFIVLYMTRTSFKDDVVEDIPKKVKNVKIALAKKERLQKYFDVIGDVEMETLVDIYPKSEGKIHALLVKAGDRVVVDQALIEVDPSKPSFKIHPVPSPITGVVMDLSAQKGTWVTANTSLGKVGVPDKLKVATRISETQVFSLKKGLRAKVRLHALQDKMFLAKIDQIDPMVDKETRTKKVTLKFDSFEPSIHAGMFAKIRFFLAPQPPQIVVPQEAIVIRGEKTVIFVAKDEQAHLKEVVKGLSVDGFTEILQGIGLNDAVIVMGQDSLIDGSAIRLTNSPDKP